jgi:AcrR family transcriptional regulator
MTDREWVRAPRQARSQATLERFVDATRQLLEERSFEDITVADIVSKAERTVGSFYARFEDKYAVLHVLVDRLDERIRSLVASFCEPARWEGASVEDFVSQSVSLSVLAYRRSNSVYRAALTAAATDERFRNRRIATMRSCAEHHKTFLVGRAGELGCADVERASDRMYELVTAMLDHELLFGRFTTTAPASDVALVAELTQQCLAILGVTAQPVPPAMDVLVPH